jgi:hypothetical protein
MRAVCGAPQRLSFQWLFAFLCAGKPDYPQTRARDQGHSGRIIM